MAKTQKSVSKDIGNARREAETWLHSYWRPLAAMVYLAICVFDFIIAPSWAGLHAASVKELALAAKDLDPEVGAILVTAKPQWQPLTLMGSGLFHISFGAILGVAAWTRGAEKVELLRQMGENERSPYVQTSPMPQPYSPQAMHTNPNSVSVGPEQPVDNTDRF